jgi:hypothetical protein
MYTGAGSRRVRDHGLLPTLAAIRRSREKLPDGAALIILVDGELEEAGRCGGGGGCTTTIISFSDDH